MLQGLKRQQGREGGNDDAHLVLGAHGSRRREPRLGPCLFLIFGKGQQLAKLGRRGAAATDARDAPKPDATSTARAPGPRLTSAHGRPARPGLASRSAPARPPARARPQRRGGARPARPRSRAPFPRRSRLRPRTGRQPQPASRPGPATHPLGRRREARGGSRNGEEPDTRRATASCPQNGARAASRPRPPSASPTGFPPGGALTQRSRRRPRLEAAQMPAGAGARMGGPGNTEGRAPVSETRRLEEPGGHVRFSLPPRNAASGFVRPTAGPSGGARAPGKRARLA
ncbi:translation initiation factor IF-2-like [Cricetulus griseus]|uniref:Translation initiation factor IF-2-like n=1 Tax=Cricetulus griseus TaxID=10029 RepID=A0A9J7F8P9_CRIGR|nr:translation initiation factor IF-2-like [Cricetulus griseus]